MSARYFEFVGEDAQRKVASASKFWEVSVDGATLTVRFGKIGATGQTTIKELGSADEATAQAANLIAEKSKKGYVETAG